MISPASQRNKGAALLLFTVFFLFASVALTYLISQSIYADLVSHRLLSDSKASYIISESAVEDIIYRRINTLSVDTTEILNLGGGTATTTTTVDTGNNLVLINAVGNNNQAIRKSSVTLRVESGASFNFGVQSGNGGFDMGQSAKVVGNVFSNGPINGPGGTGPNQAIIEGSVTSAGPSGLIDGIHATASARANSIGPTTNTLIEGDAFCQTIDLGNTTVWGSVANCPSWPDEATTTLPFPDSKVDAWKATITAAIAGGTGTLIASTSAECSGGTYLLDVDTTFSDPTKVECDLELKKKGGSTTFTFLDHLWVEGDLNFKGGVTVITNPVVSTSSVLMIADDESNRTTSSKIEVENGTEFSAPSSPKSYIMLVSMNEDAENGGTETAISMGQSSEGDVIIYAGHGEITLGNSIELKEVTGYLITMGQSSIVRYESGLIDLNFVGGPGGGFEIDSWSEVE